MSIQMKCEICGETRLDRFSARGIPALRGHQLCVKDQPSVWKKLKDASRDNPEIRFILRQPYGVFVEPAYDGERLRCDIIELDCTVYVVDESNLDDAVADAIVGYALNTWAMGDTVPLPHTVA